MRKKRRRAARRRRRALLLLFAAAVVFCAAAAGLWRLLARPDAPEETPPEMLASPGTTEIVVLGVDPREDDPGRSDTLFIVSLDEAEKRASVLSVPRDTRVDMGTGAYEKINHAYAYGGADHTRAVLERLLAARMDGYVLVDLGAFARMIDAVGGVDIEVEKRMAYEDPWDDNGGLVIDLEPGEQRLDGARAMQYVRYRDEEGDIGRIARQQKFLRALLARAVDPEVLPRLPEIVRALAPAIETDLPLSDLLRFASLLPEVRAHGVDIATLPGKPAWWQETSYWLPRIGEARAMLAAQAGETLSPALLERAVRDEDAYEAELPRGLVDVNGTMRLAPERDAEEEKEKETEPAREAPKTEKAPEEEPKPERRARRPGEPLRPEHISVRVLNESGITGAAAETAQTLKARGFVVEEVGNGGTNTRKETVVTVPRDAEGLFRDLPFRCVTQTGEGDTAVVRIGKDYGDA